METKYHFDNSFFFDELDSNSWIEKELEEKLWELYDKITKWNNQ
jgi:hypothetical protein